MLYTIFMRPKDSGQHVFQAEGNDLKDALVQWAEEFEEDKLTRSGRQELIEIIGRLDEDRTRLVSGYHYDQAEFYTNIWMFETELDLETDSGVRTTFYVIKTAQG
jgi:hypothetical protein